MSAYKDVGEQLNWSIMNPVFIENFKEMLLLHHWWIQVSNNSSIRDLTRRGEVVYKDLYGVSCGTPRRKNQILVKIIKTYPQNLKYHEVNMFIFVQKSEKMFNFDRLDHKVDDLAHVRHSHEKGLNWLTEKNPVHRNGYTFSTTCDLKFITNGRNSNKCYHLVIYWSVYHSTSGCINCLSNSYSELCPKILIRFPD